MKYIIGLGNPGPEYERSRHNVGFMMADQLAAALGTSSKFTAHQKFKAQILKTGNLMLIKPQDYMNNSGAVARQVLNYYAKSFDLNDVLVIHDDLDIRLGEFKIQLGKGPKVHNGLLDLDRHLGSAAYWHIRVGIDNRTPADHSIPGADYVLAPFFAPELEQLETIGQKLIQQLKPLIDM